MALKAIDYGWTAFDAWQSKRVLDDPTASPEAKREAQVNILLAASFEAAEPDDLLPISLPLDDIARHGVLAAARRGVSNIGDLVRASTKLGKEKITVLGHFKVDEGLNYIQAAEKANGSYFNPGDLMRTLTPDQLWEVNAQFLRDAVARGDTIRIGTEIHWKDKESWLFREMTLLKEEFGLVLDEATGVFVKQ